MPTLPTIAIRQHSQSSSSHPGRSIHLRGASPAHRLLAVSLLGLTLALGLASCSYAPQSDPLAAVSVNGHPISLSLYQQLLTYFTAYSAAFQGQPQNWRTPDQRSTLSDFVHQQVVQSIVDTELLREQMQAQHLTVSKKNQQTASSLVNHVVAQDKIVMAQSPKDATVRSLVAAETPDVLAFLTNIQAMLITFEQQGKVPSVKAQVILVSALPDAQELLNQAQHGADFATLAKQHSMDSASAAKGGDIGSLYIGGFGANFDKQAFGPHPQNYVIVPVAGDYALFKLGQRSMQPLSGVPPTNGAPVATLQQQYLTNWLINILQPQAKVQQYVSA